MLNNKKAFLIIIILIVVFAFASCKQTAELLQTNSPTPETTPAASAEIANDITAEATKDISTPSPEPAEEVTLAPTPEPETDIYIPVNQDILNLYIGMRYEEAEIFAGKYDTITMEDARDSIGAYQNICTYPFGTIGYVQADNSPLSDSWIFFISVETPGYIGPLGIQVGDSFNSTIEKIGVSNEYFSQEYSDIYANGSILGYVYLSDSQLESWQIALYFGDNELRTFFVNVEEGKVVSFGVAEQLN